MSANGSTSQTFDRGLQVLAAIAESASPLTIDEVSGIVGLHRSVTYRLVRTLEEHHLVERNDLGRLSPGVGLAVLARSVRPTLRATAMVVLSALADELGMTAFLVVRDGDEAVAIETVEPSDTVAHVAYRPGHRHSVDRGAPGRALLIGAPAIADESADVAACRRRGWAYTRGEVLPGMAAVAAPVDATSAIAVLWLEANDARPAVSGSPATGEGIAEKVGSRLIVAAAEINARLGNR